MKIKNLKHLFHILDDFGNFYFYFYSFDIFFSKKQGILDRFFFSQNIFHRMGKIHHKTKFTKHLLEFGLPS